MNKTDDCPRFIVMLRYRQILLWESYTKGNFSSVERQPLWILDVCGSVHHSMIHKESPTRFNSVSEFLTCICLRRRSLFKVAYRAVTLTSRAYVTLTRMRAHYVVGELCISRIVTFLPHLWSFRGVLLSYLTYSVLASRTTSFSDSATAAFNRNNVEKTFTFHL
jgi:hypothetical protein